MEKRKRNTVEIIVKENDGEEDEEDEEDEEEEEDRFVPCPYSPPISTEVTNLIQVVEAVIVSFSSKLPWIDSISSPPTSSSSSSSSGGSSKGQTNDGECVCV